VAGHSADQVSLSLDAGDPVSDERGAQPDGILKQGLNQVDRIQRTIAWCPEGSGYRTKPRPTTMDLSTVEPLALVSLLLLPCDLGPQNLRLGRLDRDPGDSLLPQANVDAGSFAEARCQDRIVVSCLDTELQEGIGCVRFYLWRQHAACRTPSLTDVSASVEYQYAPAGQRQLPGAGGTYCATPHHDYLPTGGHGYLVKLFETSGRTAA
jgi:hypothetical protein